MALFHFRIHYDDYPLDNLVTFIKTASCAHLIVSEYDESDGGRPHIHSIISPTKTKSTFIQQLKAKFPKVKGNKYYSCETVKKEENLYHYLCKGINDTTMPVVHFFHPDVNPEQLHKEYWEVNKKLRTQSDGVVKKKKEKTLNWLQETKIDFCKENPTLLFTLQDITGESCYLPDSTRKLMYDNAKKILLGFILKRLGSNGKLFDDGLIVRFFKVIQNMIIQDGEHASKLTDHLFEKLSF